MVSFGDVWSANTSAARRGALSCAVLLFYVAAFHGLFLFSGTFEIDTHASIWYPPAGLRLAVLLMLGWRFGVLVFCAEAIFGVVDGMLDTWGLTSTRALSLPLIASLVAAIAIPPACYTLAAFVLERRRRAEADADPFTGILFFLFIVCLAAAANGMLGCLNLVVNGMMPWSEFPAAAAARAIGDAIGILTLTPAFLLMANYAATRWTIFPLRPPGMAWISRAALTATDTSTRRAVIKGAAVCLFVSAATIAAGAHSEHAHHSGAAHWYPFLFPVIWLALRFGLPAAIVGTFCMNIAAAFAASFGEVKPFQDAEIFMVTLSVTGLLMGSVVSQLWTEKATLDLKVRSRTRELSDEIDRRRRAEHEALREKQRVESYLLIAQPVIIAVDADARITLVNNSAIRLLGYRREELLGRDWADLVAVPAERPHLRSMHQALIAGEAAEVTTFETRMRARNGDLRVLDWRSALIRSEDGTIVGILCSGDDITEQIAAEEKLRYLASHDPVTGLNNRNWLLDHFLGATARSRRHGKLLAILFIDLTGFKQINDVYGHAHGDRVLLAIAQRLKQCVRESDAVVRLGGDEFVVVLEDVAEPASAAQVAENMLQAIAEPLAIDDIVAAVGASIGIAFYPRDGKTAEELLSRADAAMYRAKRDQAHGYRVAPEAETLAIVGESSASSRTNG